MKQKKTASARKQQGWINYYRKPFLFVGALILLGWGFLTKPEPYLKISEEVSIVLEEIGLILIFLGIITRVFSSLSIGSHKNQKVVDTGLYSLVRNPLYLGSFLILLGVAMFTTRIDVMALMIILYIICFYPMVLNEEKYLQDKFGDDYLAYKKTVPRIIPKLAKWQIPETMTINVSLVRKTLTDSLCVLLIVIIIEVIELLL